MKKKVLVISASPRKGGNSDILCDQFMRGASESGHTVEKVFLRSKVVNFCHGCYACRETKRCIQNDDGNNILAKMVDADTIVFATPVYFYAMNGQLKALIDRTLPRYVELSGKSYLIATCAAPTEDAIEGTLSDYRNFLRMTPDLKDAGQIFGLNAWAKGDILGNSAVIEAYEAGKNV